MDILEKLFSSGARVKIMRLFLANPDDVFLLPEISKQLKLSSLKVRKELRLLKSVGFISKGVKEIQSSSEKNHQRKKKEIGICLSNLFPHARALKILLVDSSQISRELLTKRFRKLGRGLRLVVLSGVFVNSPGDGAIDFLIVEDAVRRGPIEKILGKIESETGRQLKYCVFSTQEYRYRDSMFDKFLRDILDAEHDVLIDNLGA